METETAIAIMRILAADNPVQVASLKKIILENLGRAPLPRPWGRSGLASSDAVFEFGLAAPLVSSLLRLQDEGHIQFKNAESGDIVPVYPATKSNCGHYARVDALISVTSVEGWR